MHAYVRSAFSWYFFLCTDGATKSLNSSAVKRFSDRRLTPVPWIRKELFHLCMAQEKCQESPKEMPRDNKMNACLTYWSTFECPCPKCWTCKTKSQAEKSTHTHNWNFPFSMLPVSLPFQWIIGTTLKRSRNTVNTTYLSGSCHNSPVCRMPSGPLPYGHLCRLDFDKNS